MGPTAGKRCTFSVKFDYVGQERAGERTVRISDRCDWGHLKECPHSGGKEEAREVKLKAKMGPKPRSKVRHS